MAKRYYWLKLKDDFFTDKRIKKLRKIAGGDTFVLIYLKLQLLSLQNEGMLEYEGIEDDFAEEVSLMLDEDLENVEVTLNFLRQTGLLVESEIPNEYLLPETQTLIGSESASAERVRKYRERQKGEIETPKEEQKELPKPKKKTKKFVKPTIEQITEYCKERNNNINSEHFYDHYESKGWKVGNVGMKDWKAAVRTWERNNFNNNNDKPKTKAQQDKDNFYKSLNDRFDVEGNKNEETNI